LVKELLIKPKSVVTTSQPPVNQVRLKTIQDAGQPTALGDLGKSVSVHVTADGFAANSHSRCDLTLADTPLMQFDHLLIARQASSSALLPYSFLLG
jgi:hypothetical protein